MLTSTDGPAARRLVHAAYSGTRYFTRAMELLALALGGRDPECAGVVSETSGNVDALLLRGSVAGAVDVEKVHALIGGDVEAMSRLVDALRRASHWRMIVAELPEDQWHATAAAALVSRGFTREGSVAGFVSDDTSLALMVLRRA